MELASLLDELEARYGTPSFAVDDDGTSITFDDITVDIVPIEETGEVFLFSSLTALPATDDAAQEILVENHGFRDARSGFSLDDESGTVCLSTRLDVRRMDADDFAAGILEHVGRGRSMRVRIEQHADTGRQETEADDGEASPASNDTRIPDSWLSI